MLICPRSILSVTPFMSLPPQRLAFLPRVLIRRSNKLFNYGVPAIDGLRQLWQFSPVLVGRIVL
jgi:hypothetical protein